MFVTCQIIAELNDEYEPKEEYYFFDDNKFPCLVLRVSEMERKSSVYKYILHLLKSNGKIQDYWIGSGQFIEVLLS